MRKLLLGIVAALLVPSPAFAREPLDLDPALPEAASLAVTVFAADLAYPMGITALPDGSLLVGESVPGASGLFGSTGQLRRLVDADGDGEADDAGALLAEKLPGVITSVTQAGDLVFVDAAPPGHSMLSVFQRGETWADPLQKIGVIRLTFNGADHQSYGLASRISPTDPAAVELFFNIGAYANDAAGRQAVATGSLLRGHLDDATVYRATFRPGPDADTPWVASGPDLVATGLRNASAMTWDPATGDLLLAENGIDTPSNRIVALSADEVDRVPAAAIGTTVIDFGFPDTWVDITTGEQVGTSGTAPDIAFLPIGDSQNEGIASIAVIPDSFPAGLAGNVVAGFHGQFDQASAGNEENPVIVADLATGMTRTLVSNDDERVGHIDTLLATGTTLYLVDLCTLGTLSTADRCGVIYAITPR